MSDVELELIDGIAVATINRPERLNAFRRTTYEELHAIVARLDCEPAWRALVVTGAGRAFSAGQDLDELSGADVDPAQLQVRVDVLQEITRSLARTAKATIAAINGPAVGFGFEFTLALDLRVAGPDASFMLPELARGLFQTNGTYHYLVALVGRGMAGDLILTGRRIGAEEALRAGLVTRLEPADRLVACCVEAAQRLASLDPTALAYAKDGLRHAAGRPLEQTLQFEADACLALLARGLPREDRR